MVGRDLAQYRILHKLGAGGMGEVYLALDTVLERQVALKVLAPKLTEAATHLERFTREAKLLASLNHPNIVTIYSVEEHDGLHFFTMEVIDGPRLDEMLPADGLSGERFFATAVPLCEAISAAHGRDIVHRDLKPANVMLAADGRVKVLDFGLARSGAVATPDDGEAATVSLTGEGSLLGTLAYMAPEQVKSLPVDHRTDIFSLGALLYEMAAGRPPFAGDSAADLIAAILRDQPPPLDRIRPTLPRRLSRLVERCLEKDPGRRWDSVLDLLHELEEISSAGASGERILSAVAVLPFSDLSAGKDQEYFCDGIAEELINGLNNVEGLHVASRSSSFRFRDSSLDAREIGRRLQVDSLIEGSVRKAGDRLRITVALVGVSDGYDLWSRQFDRQMADVFEIQEQIAQSVVAALKLDLTPAERQRLEKPAAQVVGAYDCYLRGRKFFYQYSRRGMELALERFSEAIDLDPTYALAWAGLADCCSFLYANSELDPKQLERALEASARALAEAPELAEAHVSRAVALSYTDRVAEARREFSTALRLDPRSFEATYFYARHCFTQERVESAIRLYERASTLRPDDFQALLLLAQNYEDLGRTRDAEQARRRGLRRVEERLELRPDDSRALYMGANALVALGAIERGLEWADEAKRLEPEEPMVLFNLACIYSMAGKVDAAIDCLDKSLRRGVAYQEWARHDSNLDPVRQDPRFKELIAEIEMAHAT